jgi:hypothetical protein
MQLFKKSQSGENLGFFKKKFLFAIFFGVAFWQNFAKRKIKKTLIGDGTKKCKCLHLFSRTARLSEQDVCGDDRIHFHAAHTQFFFLGLIMCACQDPKFVSGHHPSFSQKDKGQTRKNNLNQTFVKKIGAKKLLYHLQ